MSKRAIVTGASSGIGQETARQLAGAGWQVLAVARRIERLNDLAGEFGQRIAAFAADISRPESAAKIVAEAERRMGGVDLLVNNAGTSWVGPVEKTSAEIIDRIFNLNVRGLMLLCREVIPAMRRAAGGQIINVSSVAAHLPMETLAAYCASKAAVSMFTAVLAKELAADRIRVNAFSPCGTDSEIFQQAGVAKPDAVHLVPADQMARMVLLLTELPAGLDVGQLVLHQRLGPLGLI